VEFGKNIDTKTKVTKLISSCSACYQALSNLKKTQIKLQAGSGVLNSLSLSLFTDEPEEKPSKCSSARIAGQK